MKNVISFLVPLVLMFLLTAAPDGSGMPQLKEITVTGEIVDVSCYVKMSALGTDHKECAIGCAKAGMPLALLEDKTGKLFMLVSDKEFENVNVKLQPLDKVIAQKSIRIKGRLYEKGGQQLLEVLSVEKGK
jgi:hypothetical protein